MSLSDLTSFSKDPKAKMEIIKKGYLLKKGEINTSWRVRWFVLTNNELYYYKSSENSKPVGVIPLEKSVCRMTTTDTGKKHAFEIVTNQRVYQLSSQTHEELIDWMTKLSRSTFFNVENELFDQAEIFIHTILRQKFQQQESKFLELASILEKQKKEKPVKNLDEETSKFPRNTENFDFRENFYYDTLATELGISNDVQKSKAKKNSEIQISETKKKIPQKSRSHALLNVSASPKSFGENHFDSFSTEHDEDENEEDNNTVGKNNIETNNEENEKKNENNNLKNSKNENLTEEKLNSSFDSSSSLQHRGKFKGLQNLIRNETKKE